MISSDHGRRVFALEIGGLEYRYHSGAGLVGLDSTITAGINYVDVEAIVGVSSYSSSLDISGGIAQYSALTLTLAIDRRRGGAGDPGLIFGRCGARSASTRSQISATAKRADTTIDTVKDLSGLSYPRLMHIGAETIRASSATSTTITCSRSVGNTPRQTHSIDLEGSLVPEITTEITTFRGRRVKLYAAHRYQSGALSDWVEIVCGIIETSPTIQDDETVSISIVPLTALIDTSLADKGTSQAFLLDGYHYYGTEANTLEYGLKVGFITSYEIDQTSAITASTISLIADGTSTIVDDFDPTLPDGSADVNNAGLNHPRYPRLLELYSTWTSFAFPNSIATAVNGDGETIYTCSLTSRSESFTQAELEDLRHLSLKSLVEVKQHTLGTDALKEWPAVINETLDNNGPASSTGLSGGPLSWRLNGRNEMVVSKMSASAAKAELILWSGRAAYILASRNFDLGAWTTALHWPNSNRAEPIAEDRDRVSYPLNYGQGRSARDQLGYNDQYNAGPVLVEPIALEPPTTATKFDVDIATAYYQIYEDRILVDSSLGLPSSAGADRFDILVRFPKFDAVGGAETMFDQVFVATHETTATYSGSDVGYYIHLDPNQDLSDNESFGNWPDAERVLVYRAARLRGDRPGVALLKLLESGGGGAINGAYDVFTAGLNINSALIDEESFLAVDSTAITTIDTFLSGDSSDIRRLVENILQLLGAAIVMRRSPTTRKSKLTLVSLGAEISGQAALTIEAGDWVADPPPTWSTIEDLVTQIEYEYDYDPVDEKYQSRAIFNNMEAVNRYGGERAKISLSLPGLSSRQFGRGAGDRFAQFLPISNRIFNLLSNPLRLWRGSIGSGQSIYLDVGSYVIVSSPHLKGYSDSYGVTEGVGMVRAIRQELMGEGCELEIITVGLSPVAWNATARVTSITVDTATVAADVFSSSSVDDVSFFAVGDVVDYLPRGDHDSAITGLEIQSISGNTITFTAAHGISTLNGTLEPTTYANASSDHRQDAYLANSSDIINVTVDAQEFS